MLHLLIECQIARRVREFEAAPPIIRSTIFGQICNSCGVYYDEKAT